MVKPPLTFEARLKMLEEGASFTNFRALKFETRTEQEKMRIEELVLNKMGRWKYSPDQVASEVPKELLERLQIRWEAATKTVNDIYEQTLKNLLPRLTNTEVKSSLKDHKGKMMIRFHTCLLLIKDIEHVVNDATNMWKNIYHLHKSSDDTVEIKDINSDDDSDDDDDIEDNPGDLHSIMQEVEEEAEKELEEDEAEKEMEEKEDEQAEVEEDPVQIAAAVIASLPHSPSKIVTSTMETAPTDKSS